MTSRFLPSHEEAIVRDAARAFDVDRMPVAAMRALRDAGTAEGFDRSTWREITALGWPGIAIDPRHSGSGLGIRALLGVIEEMGRVLAASPLAASALVAATAIARFAAPDTADRWLPAIARGDAIAALAAGDEAMRVEDGRLSGSRCFVPDGIAADLLLVTVDSDLLALVDANAPGVAIRRVEAVRGAGGRGLVEPRPVELERVLDVR